MYSDNPHTCYKGGPSPIDEQESEELATDWKVCYGCGKLLVDKFVQEAADMIHVMQKERKIGDAGPPTERKE